MIRITQKGDFRNLDKYFVKAIEVSKYDDAKINNYINECINKLVQVTPKDTGLTSRSWTYTITRSNESLKITINNTNIQNGLNIALLLEFGHATRNGTWVEGKNYIEPVIFDAYKKILDETWEEVEAI